MATFPTSVAGDSDLYIAVNNKVTNLSAGISSSDMTIPVASTTGFPSVGYITIDNEIIHYTSVGASQFNADVRGADGTSAVLHLIGVQVNHNVIAAHHNVCKDEIKAIEQFISDLIGRVNTQMQVPVGSVGAPGFSFTGDSNTGIYWTSADQFRITTAGVDRFYFGATDAGVLSNPFYVQDGNAALPGLGFFNDVNTGLYRIGSDAIGISTGGVAQFQFASNHFGVAGTNTTGQIYGSAGSASVPSFSFNVAGSVDTGIYLIGAGIMGVSIDGAAKFQFNGDTFATTGTNTAGQILSATGSASAPSFTFNVSGGSTTGIYYIASSTLAFATGGTLAAIFDSSQNLDLKAHRLINGAGVQGTATNNSATAGDVGEVVSSTISGNNALPTSNQMGDLGSISLTAGHWMISCNARLQSIDPTLITDWAIAMSSTSGNSTAGLTINVNEEIYTVAAGWMRANELITIANFEVKLTSTTTYYLKHYGFYSGGTHYDSGRITAVRIR